MEMWSNCPGNHNKSFWVIASLSFLYSLGSLLVGKICNGREHLWDPDCLIWVKGITKLSKKMFSIGIKLQRVLRCEVMRVSLVHVIQRCWRQNLNKLCLRVFHRSVIFCQKCCLIELADALGKDKLLLERH